MSQGGLGYGRDEGHDPVHLHVGRSVTALSAGPAPLMLACATLGVAIAGYLTLVQLDILGPVWDPLFGSASSQAVLDFTHPLPDAAAGVLAYAAELTLLLARRARVLLGLILIAGGLTSLALILTQAVLVERWCTLCLASAALSLALLALGRNEARTALRRLRVTIATSRAHQH